MVARENKKRYGLQPRDTITNKIEYVLFVSLRRSLSPIVIIINQTMGSFLELL